MIFLWSPESSLYSLIPLYPSSTLDLLSSLFLKCPREKDNIERWSRRATDVLSPSFHLVTHMLGYWERQPHPMVHVAAGRATVILSLLTFSMKFSINKH